MEKHLAVIGNPIAHSLSPAMHSGGYQALGLAAEYTRFEVKPGELDQAVRGLKALGFTGWNVTVPYKEAIIPFLDELTRDAEGAGAVNTVKVTEGRLIGHNTDGQGFLRSIQNDIHLERGMKVVLLGAGGAAKGIASALIPFGLKITILNRTKERANDLVEWINQQGGDAIVEDWGAGPWLNDSHLIIQTTSLGLKGEPYAFSLEGISPATLVVDIIFNPWETPFLQEARKLGCQALNGLGMLLYQGALSWEFWFGGQAPVAAMERALLNSLQKE